MIQAHLIKALRWLPQRGLPPAPPLAPLPVSLTVLTRADTPQARCQVTERAAPRVVLLEPVRPRLSIHRHPDDLRRTVISGRFAEVCAALEGLAASEPEAA